MNIEINNSKTKIALFIVIAVFFVGISTPISLDSFAGEVVQALLSGEAISSRWGGVSGTISGKRGESTESFHTISLGNQKAGSIAETSFKGRLDDRHYFAVIPFNSGEEFNLDKLSNATPADMEAGELFDKQDFPIFYPDSISYSLVSDSPAETFTKTGTLKILNKNFNGTKAFLQTNVPTYILSYEVNGDKKPIFLTSIDEYTSCYNGDSCNYQFLLPNIGGQNYHFYMLPETRPVNITTYINGEQSDTFPYAGRPYSLNVTTRSIFQGNKLVNRSIRIIETEGNNLFTPAISGDDYESEAKIIANTSGGHKEILFSPTPYNSPDEYNLSVQALTENGFVARTEYLTVSNSQFNPSEDGPTEIGMGDYTTPYKKGVNRLTPIANCLFQKISIGRSYRLEPDSNTQKYTLVRGIPYQIDISNTNADVFGLEEAGSHLVMMPARSDDFGETTIHMSRDGEKFLESNRVVFTPTISSSEDDNFSLDLYSNQGVLQRKINISVKGSTCGIPEEGVQTTLPNLNAFKKRINSITPILNSLFVAGS